MILLLDSFFFLGDDLPLIIDGVLDLLIKDWSNALSIWKRVDSSINGNILTLKFLSSILPEESNAMFWNSFIYLSLIPTPFTLGLLGLSSAIDSLSFISS